MSWLRLDDAHFEHRKLKRLFRDGGSGAAWAYVLWIGILAYCKRHLTDGRIDALDLDSPKGPKRENARERAYELLVRCELVARGEDGSIQVADYAQWNETRADVLRARSEDAARKAAWRKNRGLHLVSQPDSDVAPSPCDSGVPSVSRTPYPPHPPPLPLPVVSGNAALALAPTPAPKRKRAPATGTWRNVLKAFPDWQPNDYHEALAAKYSKDLRVEAAKFKDHFFKDPKEDPDKTFNNWLRRT